MRETEGWLDDIECCQEKQDDRMKDMDGNMARVDRTAKKLENTTVLRIRIQDPGLGPF